jgi:isopropylmalate/homocitrate/citramalate synthase
MVAITKQAIEVIEYIKSRGCEVRFSTEDSFRFVITLLPIQDVTKTDSLLPLAYLLSPLLVYL